MKPKLEKGEFYIIKFFAKNLYEVRDLQFCMELSKFFK